MSNTQMCLTGLQLVITIAEALAKEATISDKLEIKVEGQVLV